eukprot:292330_1
MMFVYDEDLRIYKNKLIVRELRILHKRQLILDQIVIGAIQQLAHDNKNILDLNIFIAIYKQQIRHRFTSSQSAIMSLCAHSIGNILEKWKGYKPDKKVIHSFRDYFQSCRCWFDTKKIQMMAINFWIPSMQLIQELAIKTANRLFGGHHENELQTSFCKYLNVMLLQSVFEGYMKPSNARRMWLVPAMSYRIFLERYSHHLRVVLKRHPKSDKALRREYVKCINVSHDEARERFRGAMNQYLSSYATPMPLPSVPIQNNNAFSVRCAAHGHRPGTYALNGTHHTNTIWRQSHSTTDIAFVFQNDGATVAYTVSF